MLGLPTFDFQYLYPSMMSCLNLLESGIPVPEEMIQEELNDKKSAEEFLATIDKKYEEDFNK